MIAVLWELRRERPAEQQERQRRFDEEQMRRREEALGNPLVVGAVTLVLGLVALAACALPARRATRIDPIAALSE